MSERENCIDAKNERMRALGIVTGSVEELLDVVARKDCNGDVVALSVAAFLGEPIFCHHKKHDVPLSIVQAVTPYYTGRSMPLDGNLVCEMDCLRSCQPAAA